jgi:Uma2 family endonuclease
MRSSAVPVADSVPAADHFVFLHSVPWSGFEALLQLRGDRAGPRIAYLRGALELMSPSKDHERITSYIGRLVETYAVEADIELSPYRSWTLKKEIRKAGAEPDECYILGPDQSKESPDLVIEVVWTSGGLDKLEIYRRLGIPEFWQWKQNRIDVHVLRKGQYERTRRSIALPGLDLDLMTSFLDCRSITQAIRRFREALAGVRRRARRPRRRP